MSVDEVSVSAHSSAYSSRKTDQAMPAMAPTPVQYENATMAPMAMQYENAPLAPTYENVPMTTTTVQYENVPMTTTTAQYENASMAPTTPTEAIKIEETTTTTTTTKETRGLGTTYRPQEYTSTITTTVDPATRETIRQDMSHVPHAAILPAAAVNQHYRLPDNAYEQSTRKVSSVIVESTPLSTVKNDGVRYVEVPTVEEQVTYVTVKETREIERKVSVPQYEWEIVHKTEEVPKYVDKVVERQVYEYTDVPRPVTQVVNREVVVERPVHKRRTIPVTRTREVPGPTIERQVPYNVETKKTVLRHMDTDVPVIVAQTVRPIITESDRKISVDVLDYEPEVVPVDVHVAKPISAVVEAVGRTEARHKLVNITSGQYNTILKLLNQHMDTQSRSTLPFVAESGRVPFIPDHEAQFIVAPPEITIENWNRPIVQRNVSIPITTRQRGVDEGSVLVEQNRGNMCCGGSQRSKTQNVDYYTTQSPGHPTVGTTIPTQHQQVYVTDGGSQLISRHEVQSQGPSYVSKSVSPTGQEFVGERLEHQSNLSFKPTTAGQGKRGVCC